MRFPGEGRSEARGEARPAEAPRCGALRDAAFVLCLAPILLGAARLATLAPVDVSRPAAWLAIGLGSSGWLAALALGGGVRDSRGLAWVLAGGAIALRIVFLCVDPGLSDDSYRYVWEGALTAEGVSPYAHAPAADELGSFRSRWPETFAGVNHPEVPAAYPPLAQALHAGVVSAAGDPEPPGRARFLLRVLYGLSDLLVCVPLAVLLRVRRRPLARLAAWAWNPWIALEFAGQGHLDALAVLCGVLALACFPPRVRPPRGRAGLGLALLAVGASIKLVPALLLPFVLRRLRRPVRAAAFALGAAALTLVPFLAWTGALPRLGGLGEYAFRWESFSLVFRVLEPLFARRFAYDESWSDPRRLARALVACVWLALAFHVWRRRLEPARAAALLFGGLLALTPTLHPWYLSWIVPFLALQPVLSWSALVAAAPLCYWPLAGWRAQGIWKEPAWLWPVLAGMFWGLVLVDLARARRRLHR